MKSLGKNDCVQLPLRLRAYPMRCPSAELGPAAAHTSDRDQHERRGDGTALVWRWRASGRGAGGAANTLTHALLHLPAGPPSFINARKSTMRLFPSAPKQRAALKRAIRSFRWHWVYRHVHRSSSVAHAPPLTCAALRSSSSSASRTESCAAHENALHRHIHDVLHNPLLCGAATGLPHILMNVPAHTEVVLW